MISRFEIEQHSFGVAALILRGLITYSEIVASLLTKALRGSSLRSAPHANR
jgi:hypothetical protein